MDLYERLKREARFMARFRGHRLFPIRRTDTFINKNSGHARGAAKCRNCPAWVQIDIQPEANGVDIGGPAISTHCPTDSKWC